MNVNRFEQSDRKLGRIPHRTENTAVANLGFGVMRGEVLTFKFSFPIELAGLTVLCSEIPHEHQTWERYPSPLEGIQLIINNLTDITLLNQYYFNQNYKL